MEKRPFSVEELRLWYDPSTWFRKQLLPRPQKAFQENPRLGLELCLAVEEAQVLEYERRHEQINAPEYYKRLRHIRKNIGNLLYT